MGDPQADVSEEEESVSSFDFRSFFERYRIEYIQTGKNVKRGNIYIACPFCHNDPSHHMGVDEASGHWGCWRDKSHRGKAPTRLVRQVLGCSWIEAESIVGVKQTQVQGIDALRLKFERLSVPEDEVEPPDLSEFERFRPIRNDDEPFASYLRKRKFDSIKRLRQEYGVRISYHGYWKYRVLMPITDRDGELVGWTGRSVVKGVTPKYLSHPADSPQMKTVLFNEERAFNEPCRILTINEGPIDALKLDYYGRVLDVAAVATMGISATAAQCSRVLSLADIYDHIVVVPDRGAEGQGSALVRQLSIVKPRLAVLDDVKDAGAMSKQQVEEFCVKLKKLCGCG